MKSEAIALKIDYVPMPVTSMSVLFLCRERFTIGGGLEELETVWRLESFGYPTLVSDPSKVPLDHLKDRVMEQFSANYDRHGVRVGDVSLVENKITPVEGT